MFEEQLILVLDNYINDKYPGYYENYVGKKGPENYFGHLIHILRGSAYIFLAKIESEKSISKDDIDIPKAFYEPLKNNYKCYNAKIMQILYYPTYIKKMYRMGDIVEIFRATPMSYETGREVEVHLMSITFKEKTFFDRTNQSLEMYADFFYEHWKGEKIEHYYEY